MGREVRMVPKNWKHPKKDDGNYQPKHGRSYRVARDGWREEEEKWEQGLRKKSNYKDDGTWECSWVPIDEDCKNLSFVEWAGEHPNELYYMPGWKDEEKTHYQMYEDCSEGTPISPAMETPEELARWLADNNASAFGSQTASYEEWLATINRGSAPSAIFTPETGVISGVAASEKLNN